MTNNKLSQDFGVISLLKFAAPTTIMMVFMSMYQMVDGVFVSNFVGSDALSALNIVFPIISVTIAIAIMLVTGGSAIIARNMGEGNYKYARENFSLIVWVGIIVGIIITVFGVIFIDPIIHMLGATEILYDYCYDYLLILTLSIPLSILQMLFQTFFVTAGKPNIGLIMTVIGGLANVVLDYMFIYQFSMGVSGAALATTAGYSIPAVFGLIYFTFNKKGTLYLVKPKFRKDVLLESCANGSSEMVTNMAGAIITYLFNIIMLKYAGEDGVAAITIVLYAQFLMTSVFMGFSSGVAPVFSYNYGSENYERIKKIFKISIGFVAFTSIIVFLISEVFSGGIITVFAQKGTHVFDMAKHGFTLFSISFIFTGINIFASSMFTAFSNGKVSAVISFLRTFVFLVASLLLLPMKLGVDGVWLAVPLAEILTFVLSLFCFVKLRYAYNYY